MASILKIKDRDGNVIDIPVLKGNDGAQGEPGAKGDSFTYEDFTEEQLAALKGDKGEPFTYEDFTAEQLAALKGDKGEPGNGFTEEQIADLEANTEARHDHSNREILDGFSVDENEQLLYNDKPIVGIGESSGNDEIYVGSGEMPEGYVLQLDPNGEDTGALLPNVTEADNGKFAVVQNGIWAAVTVPNAEGVGF